jgi:hypothetical protein
VHRVRLDSPANLDSPASLSLRIRHNTLVLVIQATHKAVSQGIRVSQDIQDIRARRR